MCNINNNAVQECLSKNLLHEIFTIYGIDRLRGLLSTILCLAITGLPSAKKDAQRSIA